MIRKLTDETRNIIAHSNGDNSSDDELLLNMFMLNYNPDLIFL